MIDVEIITLSKKVYLKELNNDLTKIQLKLLTFLGVLAATIFVFATMYQKFMDNKKYLMPKIKMDLPHFEQ